MRLLKEALSCAIPLFMPSILISLLTTSCQVFAGLPLPLLPSTSKNQHLVTQSDSSLLSKCPNHLKRPILATSRTSCIPSHSLSSAMEHLFFKETPHIRLTIAFPHRTTLCSSSTFNAHFSLAYTNTL